MEKNQTMTDEQLAREGAPGVRMEAEVNPTNMM